jgi:hypothetical protein
MAEPQQRPEFIPSRRNLPRASHACQRCRVKKAKCDQRQPCANCIKHSHECTYGLRRRNARDRNKGALSSDRDCVPFQPSTLDGGDESPRRSGMPEHAHGLDRLGMPSPYYNVLGLIFNPSLCAAISTCWQRGRSGRCQPAHSRDRILRHFIQLCSSQSILCVCPTTSPSQAFQL